jgi:hypothetical protein
MVAKRAESVVIFAVHIIGDGTTDRHQLRSWCDRQNPAIWNGQPLYIAQHHTRLADKPPGALIEGNEVIQAGGVPQHSFWIQADISITTAIAMSYATWLAGYQSCNLMRIIQTHHFMRNGT